MSLIGPRPERPEFVEQFAGEIQDTPTAIEWGPGLGWAQANGLRGQTSIADRVELDNHYIKNWTPGLELRTLALTLAEVARFREERPATAEQPIRRRTRPQRRSKAGSKPDPVPCTGPPNPRSQAAGSRGCRSVAATDRAAPMPATRVCGSYGRGLFARSVLRRGSSRRRTVSGR